MSTTAVSGPLSTFTQQTDGVHNSDQGYCVMSQTATLVQNSTTAVSATLYLPQNSQIVEIIADVTTAYDSATSATLSVGQTAGGTDYAGSISTKTGGRTLPTYTAAQVAAMANITSHAAVVATVTVVGATSAGAVNVTVLYVQKP